MTFTEISMHVSKISFHLINRGFSNKQIYSFWRGIFEEAAAKAKPSDYLQVCKDFADKAFCKPKNRKTKNNMIYLNKNRPETIVTWDYKDSPCWEQIQTGVQQVQKFNLDPVFIEFETGSDQHGVMIAPKGFTAAIAKMQYDNAEAFFPIIENTEQ